MTCPRHPDAELVPAQAMQGLVKLLVCSRCDHCEVDQRPERHAPQRKLPTLNRSPRTDLQLVAPLPTGGSHLERLLRGQIASLGAPTPQTEYRFHPDRQWRTDLAWPDLRLLVEVEGGVWMRGGGRHNRAEGFTNDARKYNSCALLGYTLLRYTGDMIESGEAAREIMQVLALRAPETGEKRPHG